MFHYQNKIITRAKYKCKLCGKSMFHYNLSERTELGRIMYRKRLCWECAFWEFNTIAPPPHMEIVNEYAYQVFPYILRSNIQPGQWLGGEGKTIYLLKKNGECIRSNDFWFIGIVPVQYRLKFPPTAWYTTKDVWKSLQKSKHKCDITNCMDRYHCYRYNYKAEDEEAGIPVPLNWQVGDENCPAFIPTKDIQNFDQYIL